MHLQFYGISTLSEIQKMFIFASPAPSFKFRPKKTDLD